MIFLIQPVVKEKVAAGDPGFHIIGPDKRDPEQLPEEDIDENYHKAKAPDKTLKFSPVTDPEPAFADHRLRRQGLLTALFSAHRSFPLPSAESCASS